MYILIYIYSVGRILRPSWNHRWSLLIIRRKLSHFGGTITCYFHIYFSLWYLLHTAPARNFTWPLKSSHLQLRKGTFQGIPFVWGDMLYPAFMLNPAFIPHQYFWGWSWCWLFLDSSSLGIRSWSSHVGFMAEFNLGGCLTFETTQMSFISQILPLKWWWNHPFYWSTPKNLLPGALRQRLQTPEQLLRIDVPQLASQHLAGCEKLGGASFHVWPIKIRPQWGLPVLRIFWCNCRFYTQVGVVVHWSSFAHWNQFVCGNHAAYTPYAVFSSTSGKGHQAVARLAMEILFSIQVMFR